MFEWVFFGIGLVNSLFLIVLFYIRKRQDISVIEKFGKYYFILLIPTVYCVFLFFQKEHSIRYLIFLLIFLGFLLIEYLYDYILKVDFRNFKNWKLLVPYLIFYYAMNYGFVVMTWKYIDLKLGVGMLILWIIQIVMNLISHR